MARLTPAPIGGVPCVLVEVLREDPPRGGVLEVGGLVAPLLHNWLLHLPGVGPGLVADLLGDLAAALLGDQLGDHDGLHLAVLPGVQAALLAGGQLRRLLHLVTTFLLPLLELAVVRSADLLGRLPALRLGVALLHRPLLQPALLDRPILALLPDTHGVLGLSQSELVEEVSVDV